MKVDFAGLPVGELPDGALVVAAVAVVKTVTDDGPAYELLCSDDVTMVETLGMVGWADVKLRAELAEEHSE